MSALHSKPRSHRFQPASLNGAIASFRGEKSDMATNSSIPKTQSEPALGGNHLAPRERDDSTHSSAGASSAGSPQLGAKTPESPGLHAGSSLDLSRNQSFSDVSSYQEEWDTPIETLTVFDILDNLALPATLERWQNKLSAQTERVRRHREKLKSSTSIAKDRVVDEWRRRLPPPDEQLAKYRKRMRHSVERLGSRWNDTKAVTAREKLSFITSVLNIFVSGYLIGAFPQYFYWWFTVQLCYFMPIRLYTYHKRGYHYFLADMCYFVNLLLLVSIWVAPKSKRLFIATYCLANGNNAIAIAMWRNSLVFHSLDKVTSLFIHLMPPVTLHCLLHLTPAEIQMDKFPAIFAIKYTAPDSPLHYSLVAMILWSSVPYALWLSAYYFFITIRRRDKIAAGRPTSFTWLRKSYAHSWIGKIVLSLPEPWQEYGFMLTQYLYALGSMIPCPIWFWYRWASAIFILTLFTWSIWNGATYYIDVFGKRFQKELEQMKKEVAKWQASPDVTTSPMMTPKVAEDGSLTPREPSYASDAPRHKSESSLDKIPLLDSNGSEKSSGTDGPASEGLRERSAL